MKKLTSFDIHPKDLINGKYEIVSLLGSGWEGEVYLVREIGTDIERAAKFFFPHRNLREQTSKRYAKKLHKLRHCNILIQYYTQETYYHDGEKVVVLISEFIDGELLSEFMKRQPGKRLHPFAALHLLHDMAKGLSEIHRMKEYHGDLHNDNFIVQRFGLDFDLKLLDTYYHKTGNREHIQDDVVQMIHIFYEVLGGKKFYHSLPDEIKDICCGLKRGLILKKFNTAGKLKEHIENLEWG